METVKRNKESILDFLKNECDDSQLLSFHNIMCSNDRSNDEIYDNDEDFFKMMFDGKIYEAVRAVYYGNYKYMDEFVQFNAYGNLDSFNSVEDVIDLVELADDILENEDDYSDDIDFEDAVYVIIEQMEDEAFGVYEESGQCIVGDFDSFEDAEKWVNENDYDLVDSFNLQ